MSERMDTTLTRRTLRLNTPYMRGGDVLLAQNRLLLHGYSPGAADGIYGGNTLRAVKGLQADRALAVDGIVGIKTWAALDTAPQTKAPAAEPGALQEEFIAFLHEQVENHSIYVWGAQGQGKEVITESWIRQRETSTGNSKRAIAFWKKQTSAGYGAVLRAFDCSGLGMYWLQNVKGLSKTDRSADGMLRQCNAITRAEVTRGDWVFRVYQSGANKGKAYHIGFVVDDTQTVIEAKGRDDGVVMRRLTASGSGYWNAYGRPTVYFG